VGLNLTQPTTTNLFYSGELPCLRNTFESKRTLPTSPQVLFVLPANNARDIEAPRFNTFLKAQRRQRNLDLDGVTLVINSTGRDPRTIPGNIDVPALINITWNGSWISSGR